MSRRVIWWVVAAALVAAIGCGDDGTDADVPPEQFIEQQHEWPMQVNVDLDLLFVIDTSSSMADAAPALADAARNMAAVLDTLIPCKPSLHIGVVSSDLGAGPYAVLGCSGDGDGAALQNAPQTPGCSPPVDRYIRDVVLEDGTRDTNYDGSLADVMECILPLAADGCEFPQPLEAMRRALDGSVAANDGFLREHAFLMVVLLTDGDDCSAADTALFDPSDTTVDDPLGPLSTHRCFDFGVQCSPDTPRELGAKSDCAPRDDSPYLYPVQEYVDFLGQLTEPWRFVVSSAIGPATPVIVEAGAGDAPTLAPSCDTGTRSATPASRLAALSALTPQSEIVSMCSDSLYEVLLPIAQPLNSIVASPCLQGNLIDTDPQRDGVQPECAVTETAYPIDGDPIVTVLPECDEPDDPASSTTTPCYHTFEAPLECFDTPTQLSLAVYPDRTCVPGSRSISARCAAR